MRDHAVADSDDIACRRLADAAWHGHPLRDFNSERYALNPRAHPGDSGQAIEQIIADLAGLNGGFEPAWPQPLRVQILAHLARIRARAADINSPDKLQRKGQAAQGGQQGDCPRNQARPLGKTARIAAHRQGRAGKAQALQKPGHPLLIAVSIIKAKRFCILPPHIIKLNAGSLQLFQQPLRAQPLAGYALQQRPHGVNSKRRI